MGWTVSKLKRRFRGAGHLVHAPVAQVGGGDDVEPRPRPHHARGGLLAQFGDGDGLLRQDRDERVLDFGRAAGQLFHPHDAPRPHGAEHRRRNQRPFARPFGQQQGVVPAIADVVVGGSRRALHHQIGRARDRRRQQLRQHGLGGSRLAHQHQALGADEGDDGPVHQGIVAEELLGHAERLVAENEPAHGPGRKPPSRRTRVGVGGHQPLKLARVALFGGTAQNVRDRIGRRRGERARRSRRRRRLSSSGASQASSRVMMAVHNSFCLFSFRGLRRVTLNKGSIMTSWRRTNQPDRQPPILPPDVVTHADLQPSFSPSALLEQTNVRADQSLDKRRIRGRTMSKKALAGAASAKPISARRIWPRFAPISAGSTTLRPDLATGS